MCLPAVPAQPQRAPSPAPGERVQQRTPFQDLNLGYARSNALLQQKRLLLAFYGPDCEACTQLDERTLSLPQVLEWLDQRVVAVRQEHDAFALQSWQVRARPTLLFTTAEGEELGRIEGFLDAEALLQRAGEILAIPSGLEAAEQVLARHPDDLWARLSRARSLGNRKRGDEAGAEYLWFFDRTRGAPDWRFQREEVALRALAMIGRQGGPLRADLQARIEAAARTLLSEGDPPTAPAELELCARDLRLLNAVTGDQRGTLLVWDTLRAREGYPRQVIDELFADPALLTLLLQDRRYDDLLSALPDPVVEIERRLAEVKALEARAEADPEADLKPQLERNRVVAEAGRFYEVLLGAGREKDAGDLAELLLALDPRALTYTHLILAAKRSERLDLARALLDRGLARLEDPQELKQLQRTGEGVIGRER